MARKYTKILKLCMTPTNNPRVKTKVTLEIRKHFELKEDTHIKIYSIKQYLEDIYSIKCSHEKRSHIKSIYNFRK